MKFFTLFSLIALSFYTSLNVFSHSKAPFLNSSVDVCVDRKYYRAALYISTNKTIKKNISGIYDKVERKEFLKREHVKFRVSGKATLTNPEFFTVPNCIDTGLVDDWREEAENSNFYIQGVSSLSTDEKSDLVVHFSPILGNSVMFEISYYREEESDFRSVYRQGTILCFLICFDEFDNVIDLKVEVIAVR